MLLQAPDRPNVRPVPAPRTIPTHAFAARAYHLMTYVLYTFFVRAHASLMLRGCPAAIQILISHVL